MNRDPPTSGIHQRAHVPHGTKNDCQLRAFRRQSRTEVLVDGPLEDLGQKQVAASAVPPKNQNTNVFFSVGSLNRAFPPAPQLPPFRTRTTRGESSNPEASAPIWEIVKLRLLVLLQLGVAELRLNRSRRDSVAVGAFP